MKNKNLHRISHDSLSDVFRLINSSEKGLTDQEASERLESFGPNEGVYERCSCY